MRKLVTSFILLLILAGVAWGQYPTSYTSSTTTDLTSLAPTTNLWKLQAGGGICGWQYVVGGDGYSLCQSSSGNIYRYNPSSGSYTLMPEMGTTARSIAIVDRDNVFALNGIGGARQVIKWTGVSWVNACVCFMAQLAAAYDGTLVGITSSNQVYRSTNLGSTWTMISGSLVMNYVAAGDANQICAISTVGSEKHIFKWNGSSFVAITQPATGVVNATGCTMTRDGFIFAWGSWTGTGVAVFNVSTNTWTAISGITGTSLLSISGPSKGTATAVTTGGIPYALTLYSPWFEGHTTGSLNGCPTPGITCQPGVLHTGDLQLSLPHGLYHPHNYQSVPPTTNMDVPSFDTSPLCNPFSGPGGDLECIPIASGAVLCSQSGGNMGSPPPVETCISLPLSTSAALDGYKGQNGAGWIRGTAINVYFDSAVFTTSSSNNVFAGISSWTSINLGNNTYVNRGLVSLTCTIGNTNWPCSPIYPMIVVRCTLNPDTDICATGAGVNGIATGVHIAGPLRASIISVPKANIDQNVAHDLKSIGAHEEGHDQLLGDCCPADGSANCGFTNACTLTFGHTVMWGSMQPTSPVTPQWCDVFMSNMWRIIFGW